MYTPRLEPREKEKQGKNVKIDDLTEIRTGAESINNRSGLPLKLLLYGYNEPNVCVYLPTTTHLTFVAETTAKTRIRTGCRDTKRERPRPTPAGSGELSKVRRLQKTACREVDLSWSYLEDNSKPGLNRSFRLVLCKLWIIIHVLILKIKNAMYAQQKDKNMHDNKNVATQKSTPRGFLLNIFLLLLGLGIILI